MTEAKQTRCPHCGSTFRVSDSQLAQKGGNVRCGSCLQVFRADMHLVGAAAPAPAAEPAVPVSKPAPAPAAAARPKAKAKGSPDDESWALELLGEEHHEEAGGGADDFHVNIPVDKPAATTWGGENNTKIRLEDELSDLLDADDFDADVDRLTASQSAAENVHVISATADESWAQGILSELEQEDKKKDTKGKKYGMEVIRDDKPQKAPSKNVLLAAAVGEKVDPEMLKAARDAQAATRRESSPQTLKSAPQPRVASPAAPRPAPKDDELAFGSDEEALDFLSEDLDLGPAPAPEAPATGSNTFSLAQPLSHVDSPVELGPPAMPIAWGRLIGWGLACTFAVLLLIVQYVYFNFDRLAADDHFRPVLESACNRMGCYVPDAPDISKMRINQLVVRPDAQVGGALQVDALVANTAAFGQPFPALRLSFTDKNDQLVAARIFQPREYLRGDATRLRRIPPDTPIHVSLEVVNPGAQAVNYSLDPLF